MKVDLRMSEDFVDEIDRIADMEGISRSEVMRNLMKVGYNVVGQGNPVLIGLLNDEIRRVEARLEETKARRDRLQEQIDANFTADPENS